MRWPEVFTLEWRNRHYRWHRWYAWHPVFDGGLGQWVWLEHVMRCKRTSQAMGAGAYWQYKIQAKGPEKTLIGA